MKFVFLLEDPIGKLTKASSLSDGAFCSILVRCCTRIGIMSVLWLTPVADAAAARNTQSEASLDRNGMTVASMKHPVTISTAYQAKMRPQNHSAASFWLCYWSIPLCRRLLIDSGVVCSTMANSSHTRRSATLRYRESTCPSFLWCAASSFSLR